MQNNFGKVELRFNVDRGLIRHGNDSDSSSTMCGGGERGFPCTSKHCSDTSWVSYSSNESHRLRISPTRLTSLSATSDINCKPRVSAVLLTYSLHIGGPKDLLLRLDYFARVALRTQKTILLTRVLGYYKRNSGTARWKRRTRQSVALSCSLGLFHSPQISMCASTWKISKLYSLGFYGGFIL